MARTKKTDHMQFKETHPDNIPLSLLLEADPSEASIHSYLNDSWCFVATQNGQIIAAALIKPSSATRAELLNIAVTPALQAQGIGSQLLHFALNNVQQRGIKQVSLGTGTFGHQLSFYQRLGFRVNAVIKNHFLDNYDEPIFENGIQHKDMLRLSINLPNHQ